MLSRGRAEIGAGVVAVVLGVTYLLLPRMGTDLAAQVARAHFFASHGFTPIDLRWYAGVDQLGYSLVSQPVMALLGVRVTGVLALLGSAVLLAALLRRTGAPRPLLGALIGAVCIAGNLLSGRVTYGLGVLFGLAALLALTYPRLRLLAAIAALLASATSPVAGLFLGLVGAALLITRRLRAGLLIAVPAAVPLALSAGLFGDGGWMNISHSDTEHAVVTSLVVALLIPRTPVRVAGALSAAGVLASALVHTPVGLNATRLVIMFALPLLAAYAEIPRLSERAASRPADPGEKASLKSDLSARLREMASPKPRLPPQARETASPTPDLPARPRGESSPKPDLPARLRGESSPKPDLPARLRGEAYLKAALLAVVLLVVTWWQPPVVRGDALDIGNPTADPAYFAPLRSRLDQTSLTGRVEIPPTRDYWEAANMGEVPLARGWLRQADIDRNPLFFTTVPGATGTGVALTAESYRIWLAEQAVQYVAIPDAELSWAGRPEAALVLAGQPYLTPIWSDAHWHLYAVANAQPIVTAPATMVSQSATGVTFDAPQAGVVTLRVHYYRWLHASGGARVRANGLWTEIQVTGPGRYTLTS